MAISRSHLMDFSNIKPFSGYAMKTTEYLLWLLFLICVGLRFLNYEMNFGFNYQLHVMIIVLSGTIGSLYAVLSAIYLNGLTQNDTPPPLFDFSNVSKFRNDAASYFGVIFMLLIDSILFKISFWSGGIILGKFSLAISMIGMLILLFFEKDKHSLFFKRVFFRTLLIGALAALFCYLSPDNLIDLQWRNFPKYAEAKKRLVRDPDNKRLQEEVRQQLLEAQRKGLFH